MRNFWCIVSIAHGWHPENTLASLAPSVPPSALFLYPCRLALSIVCCPASSFAARCIISTPLSRPLMRSCVWERLLTVALLTPGLNIYCPFVRESRGTIDFLVICAGVQEIGLAVSLFIIKNHVIEIMPPNTVFHIVNFPINLSNLLLCIDLFAFNAFNIFLKSSQKCFVSHNSIYSDNLYEQNQTH